MCDFSSCGGLFAWRTKGESGWYTLRRGGTRCRVSYLDSRNIEHAVDVTADSLFEAAAVAVRAFREGALMDDLPVAGTELRIAVFPLPVEHRVRLQRVEQWAQTGTVKSPVEMLRRERVRELLGLKNERVG
jgi:hypothetical protein